jgi:Uncharacterized protein conserved in bacteria (DUF2252)
MATASRNLVRRASGPAARAAEAEHVPPADRAARGKSLRRAAPRASHASWAPRPDRPDPIALLEEQAAERLPELVPIRYGRMSASPFAFYRGAAYVMASDLADLPHTGIRVQLCGDAHLGNFGGFASPERHLLFDLNDFDETLPGPWEWDVKRLAASVAVAGRENAVKTKRRTAIVREIVSEYRHAIRRFAAMKPLDVWYAHAKVTDLRRLLRSTAGADRGRRFDQAVAKGRRRDSSRAFAKLAVLGNGEARIRADPPLIVPIADLLDRSAALRLELSARKLLESYLGSLRGDHRRLLERYRYVDLARKVVGVGSVRTLLGDPATRTRFERSPVPPGEGSAALGWVELLLGVFLGDDRGRRVEVQTLLGDRGWGVDGDHVLGVRCRGIPLGGPWTRAPSGGYG